MRNKIKNLIFDSKKGKIKLNERASIFFFCLLLATFFWFLSSLSKSYTTNLTIPLEYKLYNKAFILTEEPSDKLSILVSGNGFELLGEQMSLNRNAIQIDLAKATKVGKNRYGIPTSILNNEIYNSLDKDLRLERISTDSIHFRTDKRVEKKIKVIPNLELLFESSFNLLGDVIVNPRKVTVSGPKERMDTLEFIATKKMIKEDIADSLVFIYDLTQEKQLEGLSIDPSEIEIIVPVEKFTEKAFDIPILVKGEVSIRTFPNKVKTVFLVPLTNYEQLTENEVKASVEVGEGLGNKKTLAVQLSGIPSFAKLLRIEPERVEFIIKQ